MDKLHVQISLFLIHKCRVFPEPTHARLNLNRILKIIVNIIGLLASHDYNKKIFLLCMLLLYTTIPSVSFFSFQIVFTLRCPRKPSLSENTNITQT